MLGSEILSLSYRIVNKDATTFLDGNATNILADLNRIYGHRVIDILRVRVDVNASITNATTTHLSTIGLVAGNSGFNGEYAFPSTLLRPTRFEISYDGVNWLKATIYDNALNTGSEYNNTQLVGAFSEESPRVDFTRNSYKIRPPKTTSGNISNGIYIEYEKRQTDILTSTEPVEIEQNLQDLLAFDLASLETVMHAAKYTPQELAVFNAKHKEAEQRFLEFYSTNIPTRKTLNFDFSSLPQ